MVSNIMNDPPTREKAKQELIQSYTETVFNSLPADVQDKMVEREHHTMTLEWREANLKAAEERTEKAKAMAQEMKSKMEPFRVGWNDEYESAPRVIGVPLRLDKSAELFEKSSVLYLDRIVGFRRQTVLDMAPEMHRLFDDALSHDNVFSSYRAYIMFHIWTGGQRRAGTRAVAIVKENIEEDVDILYDELDKLIADIKEVQEGYEFIFSGDRNSYIHFHFVVRYYPKPESILNWGDNIQSIERCGVFDIFTANGDEDCVLQCSKRIWPVEKWGKEATEDTIDKLIIRAKGKVCIVKPNGRYFREINSYADIMPDQISPIKDLNVIKLDVVYLLHFNGHIGVLENMQPQRKRQTMTSFRPLHEFPKCKSITVCFDIECYFDPIGETKHIPYLCCACFVYDCGINSVTGRAAEEVGNVVEFEGRDCVAQMLDHAADVATELGHKSIELIAHNGGGYDFHYILSSMYNPAIVKDILIRNNHFISFKFKHMKIDFRVKDSLNFLLCSLSSAAKAFLINSNGKVDLDKTDFPHHEVRTKEDLQRTFQKWISVDQITNVDVEKEKMLITSKHIVNYEPVSEVKPLIDWAKEYCCNDVIVLANVWIKFKQLCEDIFSCNIVDQSYTLAGMSFRLFEAHLPSHVKLHHPLKKDFENMRESLIGGRCVSMNGIYEDVLCLDVKSLYPAAMAFYDQPYGKFRKVTQRPPDELGIYYVQVTINNAKNGFFPIKSENKVSYSSGYIAYNGWYTSVDIDIGIAEGHKIIYKEFENKYIGYSWKNKGKIFKDYIQDVLYRLKLQYEEAGDKEKRQVIKIIMNSLWGKFAQKWMDTKYKIVNEDNADLELECHKIWDTEHMLVKTHKNTKFSSKPVQNGVFTLSWARWHMKMIWDAIAKPHQHVTACPAGCQKQHQHVGAVDACGSSCTKKTDAVMLYSDTDSMVVSKEQINSDAIFKINGNDMSVIGSDVGQLEIECMFDEFICVGKKQYIGKYYDYSNDVQTGKSELSTKYKKRFKGVPQQYIRPEMYAHLLESKNNKVQIDFLKFKREWGAIRGYIESKTVTQT